MKIYPFLFLATWLFVACAAPNNVTENSQEIVEPTASIVLDEETGLPFNPEIIPEGEFVVEGVINAVTVIPQDKPLFKIISETGIVYQINAQPISQIFMEDGTSLRAIDFKNGMVVRATVFQGEEGGLGGEPVLTSENLTILVVTE